MNRTFDPVAKDVKVGGTSFLFTSPGFLLAPAHPHVPLKRLAGLAGWLAASPALPASQTRAA